MQSMRFEQAERKGNETLGKTAGAQDEQSDKQTVPGASASVAAAAGVATAGVGMLQSPAEQQAAAMVDMQRTILPEQTRWQAFVDAEEDEEDAQCEARYTKGHDKEMAELRIRLRKRLGREANDAELQEERDADDAEEDAKCEARYAKERMQRDARCAKWRDMDMAELRIRLRKRLGREANDADLQEERDADDAEEDAQRDARCAKWRDKKGAEQRARFDAFELKLHPRAATSTSVGMVSAATAAASAQSPAVVVVSTAVVLTPKDILRYPEQVQQVEVVKREIECLLYDSHQKGKMMIMMMKKLLDLRLTPQSQKEIERKEEEER